MSNLNWRCCAKNLGRFKLRTKILVRDKRDKKKVFVAKVHDFNPVNDTRTLLISNEDLIWNIKNYEYVTLGEL